MRRLILALLVSLGMSACAAMTPVTPETPRESLVAAEAAYEFALLEVKSLIVSRYILPGSDRALDVRFMIVETRAALDAWQLTPDNPKAAFAAQAILNALRAEIARMISANEDVSVWIGDPGSAGAMA